MFASLSFLALILIPTLTQATQATQPPTNTPLPIHPLIRSPTIKFENLAIRSNSQILTTSTKPNASIYQVDPLGILPLTLIHTIPNVTSACGIAEGKPDLFYIASGDVNLTSPSTTTPTSYTITEIDVRGLFVFPNGSLSRQPAVRHVASLPNAALLNGIAFAASHSDNLLVADTFRGLIWNVNVQTGTVGVTLNDTTTKGPTTTGSGSTGINGIKVHNGTAYYTNTGASTLYKVPIDSTGTIPTGVSPTLITSNLTCDDLAISHDGTAYVAGPLDIITKVSQRGEKQVIAGTFNSTSSDLVGPTAIRFGRGVSDRWSIYVSTNGGLGGGVSVVVPGAAGISRVDLG